MDNGLGHILIQHCLEPETAGHLRGIRRWLTASIHAYIHTFIIEDPHLLMVPAVSVQDISHRSAETGTHANLSNHFPVVFW